MKKIFFILISALALAGSLSAQPLMSHEEAMKKADELIATLTLQEKCDMTHGYNLFFLPGVPEKGIPYIFTADASMGVRINADIPDQNMHRQADTTTCFPTSLALAATFNPDLAYEYAKAVGEESRMSGVGILLGPGFNIYRSAQCGRNFEYYGEDPYLVSRLVEKYVEGMQSTGTMACIKHFLCNNTEFYRRRSNSIVSERAIMEIYTPAFKAGIDAGAGAVMTSYNQLNGEWAGESKYVITDLLRGTLGFKGLVMSDWKSIYDWEKVIRSGQNLDMPGSEYFYVKEDAADLVAKGVVTEKEIEDMIRPQIAACIQFGLYDRINNGEEYKWELKSKLPEHAEIAYRTAAEATVLLKNNGILPLKAEGDILLTGRFADKLARGGGSSRVAGYDLITYAAALRKEFGDNLKLVENPTEDQLAKASKVIVASGIRSVESWEQEFELDKEDEELIRRAVENNPNTIVIINSGTGVNMSAWNDRAAAVVFGWFPGQNGCQAITDILMGRVNPSGKLPMTIERSFEDSPAYGTVPEGADIKASQGNPNEYFFRIYDVNYDEGVFVGYRWYEAKNIAPLYPFGHGLSYTDFSLEKPKADRKIGAGKPAQISLTVKNTGSMAGTEVVQFYVGENRPTVERPVKELKGFQRVTLAPGEKRTISFDLDARDLAFWDETVHDWKTNAGEYTIYIGTSSTSIAHTLTITAE